jgi:hypothetical protein
MKYVSLRTLSALPVLLWVCLLTGTIAQGPPTKWYLAEGATGPMFIEEINIGNPNAAAVSARVTYFRPSGAPPITQDVTIAATSRRTLRVNSVPGLETTAVSALVESLSGQELIVDRGMYYQPSTLRNSHSANAVTAPALRWFLAEGSTGFFQQFVLIQNPNSTDANVTVTFLRETGEPVVHNMVVAANARSTVWVNQDVPGMANAQFSTVVDSTNDVTVIAERAMYFNNLTGGLDEIGVTGTATTWRFAEGFTGSGFGNALHFDTFLLLGNPNAQPANVRVTYFREAPNAPIAIDYEVAANARRTIQVDSINGLESASFGIVATSTNGVAFLAERAEYWGTGVPGLGWLDGSAVAGVTNESTRWGFADGLADGNLNGYFDTFYLVNNSGSQPIDLKASFYREDGAGIVRTFSVPAESRFTIDASAYPELSGQKFSTVLESTNGAPFVAERATYSSPAPGGSWVGGHASFGVPLATDAAAPAAVGPATVTSVSPATGFTFGGTPITIRGTNFVWGAQVFLGGAAATGAVVVDSTTIVAVSAPRAAGLVSATVVNNGQSYTLANAYTYVADVVTPPPPPPPPPYPTTGPGIVAYVANRWSERRVPTSTVGQRVANMEFLRDRVIEIGKCVGLDLAWNRKRGNFNDARSIDALAWRVNGVVEVVDIGVAYDDNTRTLQMQWAIVAGPPGYDPYPGNTCP